MQDELLSSGGILDSLDSGVRLPADFDWVSLRKGIVLEDMLTLRQGCVGPAARGSTTWTRNIQRTMSTLHEILAEAKAGITIYHLISYL